MSGKKLSRYRGKRDFSRTLEPSGEAKVPQSAKLRFVVQKHAARRLHYDLRLEMDGVFKSWAVTRGPSLDPAVKRLAVEVEDHPLEYGDFEGTIAHGQYGGGTVQLWDRGFWTPEGGKAPLAALRGGDLKFSLAGDRLRGGWVLVRMRKGAGEKRQNWLLIKHRDPDARPGDGDALLEQDRSIASGRSMTQTSAGKGRQPQPFMLSNGSAPPDAVRQAPNAVKTGKASATGSAPPAKKRRLAARRPRTGAMPDFVPPQLCKPVDRPPNEPGWAHEVKFDGYRIQLRVSGTATLRTRKGLDWTDRFDAIVKDAVKLPDCMIDGEVVALDHRHIPSFAALQAALSEGKSGDLILFAFDLLFVGREDLREWPLAKRKARLQGLLERANPGPRIRFVQHFESTANAVLKSACAMDLEGVVSKRLDAAYTSGRTDTWTKAKCRARHEVVLGGWTTEAGEVRSLLAGVNRDGRLAYVGRIGTGYGRDVKKNLLATLKKLTRTQSPFEGGNAPQRAKNVRWLEPSLVAEIEFAGWTGSGMIRQAAFKGLRHDKPASEVVAERPVPASQAAGSPDELLARTAGPKAQHRSRRLAPRRRARGPKAASGDAPARNTRDAGSATVMGVTISKPEKALWPDAGDGVPVTKRDLAKYFEDIGPWMLPHIQGRPCSLVRAPDGIDGEQFFQRHAMPGISNLFDLVRLKGDRAPYVELNRVEALAAAAQIAAVEIHPWNCAAGDPDVPSRLVFDLDPGPGVPFHAVIEAALELRERLQRLDLLCFCKTTGGKGLHVVAPLKATNPALTWSTAKTFARLICSHMAEDDPKRYLLNMAKSRRKGRIFLDYLRNDRMATAVAPLSPRARAGATVSMPLTWAEVRKGLDPKRFTIRNAAALLRASRAWMDYDKSRRSLHRAAKAATKA